MRLYPPAGLTALPAGTLIKKALIFTVVGIGGVGDNKAPINLPSVAGITRLFVEGNFRMQGQANLDFQIRFGWHRPDHTGHTAVLTEFRFSATGAGDIHGVEAHLAVEDDTPQVGNYHFNTTISVGGGTMSVYDHRLIGVV